MNIRRVLPLFKRIYMQLKADIEAGNYSVGTFLPSERVLSQQYAVERATLRKSLSLLEREGYIQKCPGAGSKVTYFSVHTGEHEYLDNSIVYVMPDSQSEQTAQPFHMEVCTLLEKHCKAIGLNLMFTKLKYEDADPPWFHAKTIKGIIWVSTIDPRLLDSARKLPIPSIVSSIDYPAFPQVNVNDLGFGYDATQHLIDQGCRNILFIGGVESCANSIGRHEGYRRALLVNGIAYQPSLVCYGDWNFKTGYDLAREAVQSRLAFDGIYAANDMMAMGAMRCLFDIGMSVPADVQVIGTDGIQQSSMSIPTLSTIQINEEDVARALFAFIVDLIEGRAVPSNILLPGYLVARESTQRHKKLSL